MKVDLAYLAHNRLEFTQASFEALLAGCEWDRVSRLHVLDDRSRDGTTDYLQDAVRRAPVPTSMESRAFGGPVAAMNHAAARCVTDTLVKVDNDFVAHPGWLAALLNVMEENPKLDVLGLEAGFGDILAPIGAERTFRRAPHIGGIGAIRLRVFKRGRPTQHGRFFGWTQWQREHHGLIGWLTPDLPCFNLDHLPVEPWRSLTRSYVERGWQRPWDPYPEAMSDYWSWWTPGQEAAA